MVSMHSNNGAWIIFTRLSYEQVHKFSQGS